MDQNPRAFKLKKLLDAVLNGKRPLTSKEGPLFIEAICSQADHAACLSQIISSKSGIQSVQVSMRSDTSPDFCNGSGKDLLLYLQSDPELRLIGGGAYLSQVLLAIVDPPFFWMDFSKHFRSGKLQDRAQLAFAWLLLQLISLSGLDASSNPYKELAETPEVLTSLTESSQLDVRVLGAKIKVILENSSTGPIDLENGPGGRHDNDFVDFRHIAILPTADELVSTATAFMRPSSFLEDPHNESTRTAIYLDNQFRLLREDMLYEMKEELLIAMKQKKGRHRGLVIEGFDTKHFDLHCGSDDRRQPWGVGLRCLDGLPQLNNRKPKDRKAFIDDNRNFLRHQSMACLLIDGKIMSFPTINRDEELLKQTPPVIVLQFVGEASTHKALIKLKTATHVKLIQIDTAVFAYEPILNALRSMNTVPLAPELVFWKDGNEPQSPRQTASSVIRALRHNPKYNMQALLSTPKSIILDNSQSASLIAALTQKVSLIQGPPGTGKSFIGALFAKAIHDTTSQTILVVCYTNHALDQFLEDLLDIGIPERSMVRLGGKSTTRTEPMSILVQRNSAPKWGKSDWTMMDRLKQDAEANCDRLERLFKSYAAAHISEADILDHLEFDDYDFFKAFEIPENKTGMTIVGRKGEAIRPIYLVQQWMQGRNAGIFKNHPQITHSSSQVWSMPPQVRQAHSQRWKEAITREKVAEIYEVAHKYNQALAKIARKRAESTTAILMSKRIIACTTTAAAKYTENIRTASPDVVLVEEAGEILESHILTAMGPDTTQLCLIGDHQQLRPKVNNYVLTVEKGDGYDLNCSLFERLVKKGYPHQTLSQQHRMRPEISALVREMTYPNLADAASTMNRPSIRGMQDFLVFISHDVLEDNVNGADAVDDAATLVSTSSKQNTHEAGIVLKIVRYLAQQGYGTDKMVVLTPYLGQLSTLRTALKTENDPVLNDLDSYDLVRAGLIPAGSATVSKRSIRIATIDNYQGEESDIVIASLTRSNPNHDIGFMFAPERLNVLLSRARNALIMIGNPETFMNARKGKELWTKFFGLLRRDGHIYDGLPVQCERHPDRKTILSTATQFDEECPDGGCKEPCSSILNCGTHRCPSKCHQLADHSKMQCNHIMRSKCPNGHAQNWRCFQRIPLTCAKCERDAKLAEKKQKAAFELQEKREREQAAHERRLAEIQQEIDREQDTIRDAALSRERDAVILQNEQDLLSAKARASEASRPTIQSSSLREQAGGIFQKAQDLLWAKTRISDDLQPNDRLDHTLKTPGPSSVHPSAPASPVSITQSGVSAKHYTTPPKSSPSKLEWERQKKMEGAVNQAIDDIMEMTGLEQVKADVLAVKARIDVAKRQNTSIKNERFNLAMTGNAGTGKTTLARLYAKFLTTIGALTGTEFVETTGSRMTTDGVPGAKKLVEDVIKAGGGTIFIDEAYQMTSQHNIQGGQVLDFLLAEMENNVGTVVFLLAGYTREMESFFEHNTGLPSRVPNKFQFADYTDAELLEMFQQLLRKQYDDRMKVEGGYDGLFARITVRRLGRGRGAPGFGNVRALQNMVGKIKDRQAVRLTQQRALGQKPDDMLLTQYDLIGPQPSQAFLKSKAWKELQKMVGLGAVKESIKSLIDSIETNYERELKEQKPIETPLNRVLLGSPGTGKTSVAKLYGQILADLGLLSKGEVSMKNPSDFIGAALGQSESNTKAILATTVGKILIIDEAYMLYSGSSGQPDPYKTAVIDTLVAEVQSTLGEDRCVLLLGYKTEMEVMFQNVNPGLARRFRIEDAFEFQDFSDSELRQILDLKLAGQDLDATNEAKDVAIELLARERNRPNFGNGGAVENMLSKAKDNHKRRQRTLPRADRTSSVVFLPQDFDPDFARGAHASSNLQTLFSDVVGRDDVIQKLGQYQETARKMKARRIDPRGRIPMNFCFNGPPGTGKTLIARKMGKIFYDMGLLSSTDVIECSATDMIGQYVGHTGPKTTQLFEKASGKVLFVDEAYRLGEGPFAKEAIDELVGILTSPKFMNKVVLILAGYDREMDRLLAVNSGLKSRITETIMFHHLKPRQCVQVLQKALQKDSVILPPLQDHSSPEYLEMTDLISQLSEIEGWGNARDMMTLSSAMIRIAYDNVSDDDPDSTLTISGLQAIECIREMLDKRKNQAAHAHRTSDFDMAPLAATRPNLLAPPQFRTTSTVTTTAPPPPLYDTEEEATPVKTLRDPGVGDAVWTKLQADREAEQAVLTVALEEIRRLEEDMRQAALHHKAELEQEQAERLAQMQAKDAAEQAELKQKLEEVRLRELTARHERDARAAALEKRREEEQRRRQQEQRVQAKLRAIGVCVAGFQWIKQEDGYRCAGGSHFVYNAQLDI